MFRVSTGTEKVERRGAEDADCATGCHSTADSKEICNM